MKTVPKFVEYRDALPGLPAFIQADLHPSLCEASLDDDIGSSVTRNLHSVPSLHPVVDVTVAPAPSIVDDDEMVVSGEVLKHMTTVDEGSVLPDSRGIVRMTAKRAVSIDKISERSRKAEELRSNQHEKKAKKKRRNEIDDIFGF